MITLQCMQVAYTITPRRTVDDNNGKCISKMIIIFCRLYIIIFSIYLCPIIKVIQKKVLKRCVVGTKYLENCILCLSNSIIIQCLVSTITIIHKN